MSDLISREAAIDAIGKLSDEIYRTVEKGATFPKKEWFDGMAQAEHIVKNLPSTQPEIIRCKDCLIHGVCSYERGLGENGFCSQAKRRTDE